MFTPPPSHLLIFLVALAASLAITPLVRRWAIAAGKVARPKEDRWHRESTALMGGVEEFGGSGSEKAVIRQ